MKRFLLIALFFLAAAPAHAANVLVVLDSGADMGIATALMADGHDVTVRSGGWTGSTNPDLAGDLSAFDVVFWSQDGPGYGEAVTDSSLFTHLEDYVRAGGRVFVTGYDSLASPDDPLLVAFLGGIGSSDVVGPAGRIASIDNSMTTGVVDLRGVTPSGGDGDTDHLNSLSSDTVQVAASASGGGTQWSLRTLGSGEIAYVSNGSSSPSWTNTSPGGAGAYNGVIRNFAGLGGPACTGEGTMCTASMGRTGTCRASRCCTGCWDGMRCRTGASATQCGAGGTMCASCADTDLCTSDVCTAGVCSNPDAPAGTQCDDSLFCTANDRCDGAGTCNGSGFRCDDAESCTTDTCVEATDRCDHAPLADLAACMVGTRGGVCRTARCCVGCWNGTVCQNGTSPTFCGVNGGLCASCVDGVTCSSDVCTAGVCSNPNAPAGTACDDGLFCTATDRCDAMRTCIGSGARCNDGATCTTDSCDESVDRCSFVPTMGCTIGGGCVAEGTRNPTYPCQVCDPSRTANDWSPSAVGAECGDTTCAGGRIREHTCDAAGLCVSSVVMECPTLVCADDTTCATPCTASSCAANERCNPTTQMCEPLAERGDHCRVSDDCADGACSDGVCCESPCDGICERCNAPGLEGMCLAIPRGADPISECADSMCDGNRGCLSPDAGAEGDAGDERFDGGIFGADAGRERMTEGCGCSVRATTTPAWTLLLAIALLIRRRR